MTFGLCDGTCAMLRCRCDKQLGERRARSGIGAGAEGLRSSGLPRGSPLLAVHRHIGCKKVRSVLANRSGRVNAARRCALADFLQHPQNRRCSVTDTQVGLSISQDNECGLRQTRLSSRPSLQCRPATFKMPLAYSRTFFVPARTALDALSAGVPVLTRLGETFAPRVAASLNSAVGLSDLIVNSLEDYESLALRLANNPEYLAAIRLRLSGNRLAPPSFDAGRFTRNIEAAYTAMWRRHCASAPPESFSVSPGR